MHVEIITPEAQLYNGEAESLKLPGTKGSFQVLNSHAPVVSSLTKGEVVLQTKEGEKAFPVESGFVEVLNNKVIVLV